MKTLKTLFFVALMSFATVAFSGGEMKTNSKSTNEIGPLPSKAVRLHISQVYNIPGLLDAMRIQLDESSFLDNPSEHILVALVVFNNTNYFIFGTVDEWVLFFKTDS